MYAEKFKQWMHQNLNSKKITKKKYFDAINTITSELRNWGYPEEDLYSINDTEFIDKVMSSEAFIQKNKRGNQMYSAALNHYKRFLASQSSGVEGMKIKEDVVLIKINRSYKENMTPDELYHATSFSWVASFKKTETRDIKYYCAVFQNKIIEVYDFLGSEEELPRRDPSRYILKGQVASSENLRNSLIDLDVSELHRGSGNPIKYTNLETLLNLNKVGEQSTESKREILDEGKIVEKMHSYILSKGFSYSLSSVINLYLSLRSKPFVIISGISGTGKTKIVQLFAEAIGATEENGQFKLIPVRPDWSDSSELLGYTDIKGDFVKGPLTEMVEHAHQNPELPHFVLLDEMNLARVEYYFSDVLSVMESRKRVDGKITSSTLVTVEGEPLTLPGNLYIIGTVNMDETTHPFSKKVLDRANTIEFNEINLMNFGSMTRSESVEPIHVSNEILESSFIHLIDAFSIHEQLIREVSEKLEAINQHLAPIHAQVGYRVRDEISFYMAHNTEAEHLLSPTDAMDFCIMQKILPRVGGMETVVRPVLEALEEELDSYPRCTKKIKEMLGRFGEDGFTSFWIS